MLYKHNDPSLKLQQLGLTPWQMRIRPKNYLQFDCRNLLGHSRICLVCPKPTSVDKQTSILIEQILFYCHEISVTDHLITANVQLSCDDAIYVNTMISPYKRVLVIAYESSVQASANLLQHPQMVVMSLNNLLIDAKLKRKLYLELADSDFAQASV